MRTCLTGSLDSNDRAQTLIFDIASLAGLATAGIAGLGWVMGICSGAAAMGAIEVVGGLAVAAMIAEAVLAAIQGAQERQVGSYTPSSPGCATKY